MSGSAPPFAYYGGKAKLADRLVALMPEHRHYVEPFAGSLAVLLAKPPVPFETANDIDGDLMTFWRVLREQPEELIRACYLTPHSRLEYQQAYARAEVDDIERARRIWVCLSQGRGGTLRTTGWRLFEKPVGSTSMPDILTAYASRMAPTVERLRRVSLECRPALDVVRDYGEHPDVLLYVDPPYLGTTRSSRQYGVEMAGPEEHEALAAALQACAATVLLSGYHSALYDKLYAGWHRVELSAFTMQGPTNGRRTEVVWMNRPPREDLLSGHRT